MAETTAKTTRMRRQPRQARSLERVDRILDIAEQMFIDEGYSATTTNAIAARAKISIGSLYQFFPDKQAIIQALASRYMEVLRRKFLELHEIELKSLSLAEYVDRIIEAIEQFFHDYPGYNAIFMQVQGTIPELEEIEEAADNLLIQDWAKILAEYRGGLESEDYEAIAFMLVKSIANALWLLLPQQERFRERLILETKRLTLSYLQSYFPSESLN